MREKYGAAVLPTPIRTSSSLASTAHDGRTVFDVNPGIRGAVDYAAAALDVLAVFETTSTAHPNPALAPPDPTPAETDALSARPAPAGWTTLDQL